MNDLILLVHEIRTTDEYGDQAVTYTSREVFCRIKSIGQKEFYQAQAVGMQPEIKFVLADCLDYENEPIVEYEGDRYRILRTYRTGQELELVCYREVNPA